MQIFKYLVISLLVGITGIYTVSQAEDNCNAYGIETVNESDVLKCLEKNKEKTLRKIEEDCLQYSFQVLYEVYKKNSDELVKAVCEVCENKTINDFLLWEDFINEVKTKLGSKEVINEERIREILKKIDKEDYIKFLQDDLL